LLLTYHELVPRIISKDSYDWNVRVGKIERTTRGGNGRVVEVVFESLPDKYKRLVQEQYGDPYEFAANSAIKRYLNTDLTAVQFYNKYRLESGTGLPEEAQQAYVKAAEWLNMINHLTGKGSGDLRKLNLTREQFWATVCRLIETESIELPASYSRLTRKLNEYVPNNYDALISKKYGNRNSEKINEEASQWLIAQYALPIKQSTAKLWVMYNKLADKKGWKQLQSEQAIIEFLNRKEIEPLWYGSRHGELLANERYGYQLKTIMPSFRDALWYSDGTGLNFAIFENGKILRNQNFYGIMDAYSEVILGHDVSQTEDHVNQFKAAKMAIRFAQAKPYEWHYDNQGGHKKRESQAFFNKAAKVHFPTQPYNGKSKTIENAFGRFQTQVLRQDWFYTGQNITTKKLDSKANQEFILKNKASLPSLSQAKQILAERIAEWNNMPHPKTGIPRIEMYLSSVNPHHQPVDHLDMVNLFWHTTDKPRIYYTHGITLESNKVKHQYEVLKNGMPDLEFRSKYIGERFVLKYDPEDLSMVYLYLGIGDDLRFVAVAEPRLEVHRALVDHQPGELSKIRELQGIRKLEAQTRKSKTEKIKANAKVHERDLVPMTVGQLMKAESMEDMLGLYGLSDDFEEGQPLT